ncbi:hypothetical protein RFI_39044 [Reticulomyxa filosa]|uniref:Uncharacterized protein n=1 Tax=Reticulomyxa filosa TaxID=46433 RepID=X6L8V7_RETFI|nr:hypothetical protein RFI_39044 [Reticulomyxa filosa]|eukprot:ETN98452.1 hypothetical protein RFI_39044 [Reticulomyxa filosa]
MSEIVMPRLNHDDIIYYNKLPNQISRLPRSSKSPFEKWSKPIQEQILASLDDKTIVIFADLSIKSDEVAKIARFKAKMEKLELLRRPDKQSTFTNVYVLNIFFTENWNMHCANEGNNMELHKHPKQFLCSLIEAKSFEKIVLHKLEAHESKFICRIITVKV